METIQRGFMAYGVQTSMNCHTGLFSRADLYVLSVKKKHFSRKIVMEVSIFCVENAVSYAIGRFPRRVYEGSLLEHGFTCSFTTHAASLGFSPGSKFIPSRA